MAVIHQPSQHVFAAFDDLLLVSEGRQMYFGEVASVRKYMEENACKAPAETGTAEHILDCISKDLLPGESEEDAVARLEHLAAIANSEQIDIGKATGKVQKFAGDSHGGPKANIFVQFKLLMSRALKENFRGKAKLIIQTVQQVSLGIIYGGIYKIGTNQASVQDRFGILSLIAIGSSNMAMASTIRAFPKEVCINNRHGVSRIFPSHAMNVIALLYRKQSLPTNSPPICTTLSRTS